MKTKFFNGEAKAKARYLRHVVGGGGFIYRAARIAGISFHNDHRRWFADDLVYRRMFEFAWQEGERRLLQEMFNHLCDWFREKPDKHTERWLLRHCGTDALQTIKRGGYPEW